MSLVEYIDRNGVVQKGEKKPSKYRKASGFRFYDVFGSLIVPILLGVIGGYYLDIQFGKKPIFTLIGFTLGIITVIYNLYLLIKSNGR